MHTTSHHIVHTIRFEAQLPNDTSLKAVQNTLRHIPWQQLLQRTFDQQPYPRPLRIDRLEIDLGNVNNTDDIAVLLQNQLQETLHTWHQQPGSTTAAPNQADELATLVHLLQYGTLPWHANHHPFNPATALDHLLQTQRAQLSAELRRLLSYHTVQTRLHTLFPQHNEPLLQLMLGDESQPLHNIQRIRQRFTSLRWTSRQEAAWQTAAWHLALQVPPGIGNQLVRTFIRLVMQDITATPTDQQLPALLKELLQLLEEEQLLLKYETPILETITHHLAAETGTQFLLKERHQITNLHVLPLLQQQLQQAASAKLNQPTPPENHPTTNNTNTPKWSPQETPQELRLQEYFVENAGIILLHIYLSQCFHSLQLLQQGQWTSEETRMQAIALLDHCTNGSTQSPEYELALNKLLCGLQPEDPITALPALNETQQQEANDLLNAVIINWPSLKKTSVTGFREAFLQRNGKLQRQEDAWYLYVEHKGMDVLLNYLPWTISIIKLSWMQYPLYVQWQTTA